MKTKNYNVQQPNGIAHTYSGVYIEVEAGILYIVEPGKHIVAVFNVGQWVKVQEVG